VITIISLKEVINSERLNAIAQKGGKMLNITPDEFICFMDRDFLNSFLSGYYGKQIMLSAAEQYVRSIESEVYF